MHKVLQSALNCKGQKPITAENSLAHLTDKSEVELALDRQISSKFVFPTLSSHSFCMAFSNILLSVVGEICFQVGCFI
jgi:hypothetical protein